MATRHSLGRFVRVVNEVIEGINSVEVYLDYAVVPGTHIRTIHAFPQRKQKTSNTPQDCNFRHNSLRVSGTHHHSNGLRPDSDKRLTAMLMPTTVKQRRSLLRGLSKTLWTHLIPFPPCSRKVLVSSSAVKWNIKTGTYYRISRGSRASPSWTGMLSPATLTLSFPAATPVWTAVAFWNKMNRTAPSPRLSSSVLPPCIQNPSGHLSALKRVQPCGPSCTLGANYMNHNL